MMEQTNESWSSDQYKDTNRWFIGCELKQNILKILNPYQKVSILEIGSYEGMSSVYFSDVLLQHPESTLICVDPFDLCDTSTTLTNETKDTFMDNISKSKNYNKTTTCIMTSDEFFKNNHKDKFDFIYIDGSHVPDQILKDLQNAYNVIVKNGIIWMDDYLGGPPNDLSIKNTIDQFIHEHEDNIEIIHRNYQIAFRKLI